MSTSSFHPNEVQRRARVASGILFGLFVLLGGAFFRTQVLENEDFSRQSEENRLREVPLPAPRGTILDRNGKIIAENLPGYSISLLARNEDSLRVTMRRIGELIAVSPEQVGASVRRYRRDPLRPTVLFGDAPFDLVSVLEERRVEFPGLIIQSAPKRFYPAGPAVAAIVGYTGEVSEAELGQPAFSSYKAGQQIGKDGIERQYESRLRGREGIRFVEVDARGRVVRESAREDLLPEAPPPLYTNIDLDLQLAVAEIFGDSLIGGAIAMDPQTGAVLALHSAPSFDPNRFIGGIPYSYWRELQEDPRRPLYNKAIKGTYPPASTWKLATAIIGMEEGIVGINDRMPVRCTGGYQFGNRYFRCWDDEGHGDVTLAQAIEKSCDVYFYQLGQRLGVQKLVEGGIRFGARARSGIDLPSETQSRFPEDPARQYYDKLYGPRGWTQAVSLNLSIGQGENAQTVVNMARFYTALATDGHAAKPEVVKGQPERVQLFRLTPRQMQDLHGALAAVVGRGTAAGSRIEGITVAGKTGTAQNSQDQVQDHAWFVGYAPAEQPRIVVAVMLEFGLHGSRAARIATKIIERYLKASVTALPPTEGD